MIVEGLSQEGPFTMSDRTCPHGQLDQRPLLLPVAQNSSTKLQDCSGNPSPLLSQRIGRDRSDTLVFTPSAAGYPPSPRFSKEAALPLDSNAEYGSPANPENVVASCSPLVRSVEAGAPPRARSDPAATLEFAALDDLRRFAVEA